jgi:regulatory protein
LIRPIRRGIGGEGKGEAEDMADHIAPGKSRRNDLERARGLEAETVSERRLERAAIAYLERYAAPSGHLRRVLLRKLERAGPLSEVERVEAARTIGRVIDKLQRLGLLDDRAYAEARVRSLHRRGRGLRAIRHQLAAKGLPTALIEEALAAFCADQPEPDLAAARALARRRRLGPYRPAAQRAERRDRDLAALARAGFSYELARRIIDASDPEALEAERAEE